MTSWMTTAQWFVHPLYKGRTPLTLTMQGAPRYFDNRATNPKTRGPCKRCGDSDHDFKQCTTVIVSLTLCTSILNDNETFTQCLTCGARDEHSPRSCPILRICYNCNAKGHIAMVRGQFLDVWRSSQVCHFRIALA